MKRVPLGVSTIAAVGLLLVGAPGAGAEVHYLGESLGRTYICDEHGGPHPNKLEFSQQLDESYDGWTSAELAVGYDRDLGDNTLPDGRVHVGRLVARAKVFHADGSKTKLGGVVVVLYAEGDRVSGWRTKDVDVRLSQGDRVRWRLKFEGVPDLGPEEWLGFGVALNSTTVPTEP
jgi:hypothetical protein